VFDAYCILRFSENTAGMTHLKMTHLKMTHLKMTHLKIINASRGSIQKYKNEKGSYTIATPTSISTTSASKNN
jgi:hypothetical protein